MSTTEPANSISPILTAALAIAKFALPRIAGGSIVDLIASLASAGLSALEIRQAFAAFNATPEQMAALDAENTVSVIDKIRQQGKDI